jgi:hypothetical protein
MSEGFAGQILGAHYCARIGSRPGLYQDCMRILIQLPGLYQDCFCKNCIEPRDTTLPGLYPELGPRSLTYYLENANAWLNFSGYNNLSSCNILFTLGFALSALLEQHE